MSLEPGQGPVTRFDFAGAAPSADEAAAAIAAIERFTADTAPAPAPPTPAVTAWQRAALIEGVSAKRSAFPADPGTGFPLGA